MGKPHHCAKGIENTMGQICPDKMSEIYQYMRIGDKAEELSLICQPKKKAETTEAPKGAI